MWQQAQKLLRRNGKNGGKTVRNKYGALLRELLYCIPCKCAMVHSFTTKDKNKRYRYYVCSKAQKQGWNTCPTKSLPAAEIERFVIDQIRGIGTDPDLLAETIRQAQVQGEKRIEELMREQRILEGELKRYHTEVRQLIAAGGKNSAGESTAKLADLQDGICNKCGNRYYTVEILHKVEEVATGKSCPDRNELVPVAHVG
ncbi:MAG: recombinase zinc beta ribbon domain-containing protein [Candidatus Schekmanbacteria bacterium]|nr:recombinase zinc beta ribbon domain-containing protein [Candidatus Schekmanbacteria bacterium]